MNGMHIDIGQFAAIRIRHTNSSLQEMVLEGANKIAALAPAILRLAAERDAVAREIVLASTGELLDLAVGVATKLFSATLIPTVSAGLSGPILTHPVVHEALSARAPFTLTPITETPIEGVRRMLARS